MVDKYYKNEDDQGCPLHLRQKLITDISIVEIEEQ